MCGIAGIISINKLLVNTQALKIMSDKLSHRGPDGEGVWINGDNTIGLSHRRLAIIDLSPQAAQPMHYMNRYSIVYNGEIYNYKELRSDLQKAGYHFTTENDTEVILAAYDFYKNNCVKYFDGMFSFAIWDEQTQTLFCARDIFGEKPFYYFKDESTFVFASEMKALWAIGIEKKVENKMMINYLALGQVTNAANQSDTFYKNIFSFPAAHTGTFSLQNMQFTLNRYRDIDKENIEEISETKAIEKIEQLLQKSISRRLRSDVTVGSSLSGGIDSSTISYFIKNQKSVLQQNKFKTFSAVFPCFEKDESDFIKKLCSNFNLQNFSVTPTADELVKDFDKLCYHQEEPFSSSSIYGQYKVYELAAKHNVKVLLDGQGADEILAGYTKYLHWYFQELIAHSKFTKAKQERKAFEKNNIQIDWNFKNKIAAYLPAHTALALEKRAYNKIVNSPYLNNELLKELNGKQWQGIYKPTVTKLNDILYYDTMQNGLEELLRYADRNSMAHGTEVRLPFLNYELVSFIFSLPAAYKISQGFTKYILRKTMHGKIPDNILWNPIKTGFETPQKKWTESSQLQEIIMGSKEKLVKEKILNPSVINYKIASKNVHEADNMDWRYLAMAKFL